MALLQKNQGRNKEEEIAAVKNDEEETLLGAWRVAAKLKFVVVFVSIWLNYPLN